MQWAAKKPSPKKLLKPMQTMFWHSRAIKKRCTRRYARSSKEFWQNWRHLVREEPSFPKPQLRWLRLKQSRRIMADGRNDVTFKVRNWIGLLLAPNGKACKAAVWSSPPARLTDTSRSSGAFIFRVCLWMRPSLAARSEATGASRTKCIG